MNWLDYLSVLLFLALLTQQTIRSNRIEEELNKAYGKEFLDWLRERE